MYIIHTDASIRLYIYNNQASDCRVERHGKKKGHCGGALADRLAKERGGEGKEGLTTLAMRDSCVERWALLRTQWRSQASVSGTQESKS